MSAAGITGRREIAQAAVSRRGSERGFFAASALLLAAGAAATLARCAALPAIGAMPLCGGGTMAMEFLPMPGQSWPGEAASFLCMWVAMMAPMMLPSLVPMLRRYRRALGGSDEVRRAGLTALAGAGYFLTWTLLGLAVFPLGAALASAEMRLPAHAVPIAVLLIAGALQFSAWKARHLAGCRAAPERGHRAPAESGAAWRHGLRLGLHCICSCAGLTAILLVVGIMDLRAMAAATAAIAAERLAPAEARVAHAIGAVLVGGGLLLIARAAGLG